jgi:hypothetical protein
MFRWFSGGGACSTPRAAQQQLRIVHQAAGIREAASTFSLKTPEECHIVELESLYTP